MGRALPIALLVLVGAVACQRSPADPAGDSSTPAENKRSSGPASTPTPTPTLGPAKSSATAASFDGDYDDEWGETKQLMSVTVRNECSSTVMLFYGQQPRPHSNYYTTMKGRSQSHTQMMPGDKVWILDEEQNGLASAQVDIGITQVIIDDSCTNIWAE